MLSILNPTEATDEVELTDWQKQEEADKEVSAMMMGAALERLLVSQPKVPRIFLGAAGTFYKGAKQHLFFWGGVLVWIGHCLCEIWRILGFTRLRYRSWMYCEIYL